MACNFNGHYDFIGHIEERDHWQPAFFDYTGLSDYFDVTGYMGDTSRSISVESLCSHITPAAFAKAKDFYKDDIFALGYYQAIENLEFELRLKCWNPR